MDLASKSGKHLQLKESYDRNTKVASVSLPPCWRCVTPCSSALCRSTRLRCRSWQPRLTSLEPTDVKSPARTSLTAVTSAWLYTVRARWAALVWAWALQHSAEASVCSRCLCGRRFGHKSRLQTHVSVQRLRSAVVVGGMWDAGTWMWRLNIRQVIKPRWKWSCLWWPVRNEAPKKTNGPETR